MSLNLQDLPFELLVQVLETGCEQELVDSPQPPFQRQRYLTRAESDRNYLVFNDGFSRRRKRYCCNLAAASKFWLNMINGTPWCWVLVVSLPGIFFPFKYDISMDIARLKSNLESAEGCDIVVCCNQPEPDYYAIHGVHPNPHHTMSMLMLHAFRLLRPHGSRIIYLDLSMWNTAGLATAIAVLRSFGPLPRLRKVVTSTQRLVHDGVDEFAQPTAFPLTSILDFPLNHDKVDLWDLSCLSQATDYETGFISTATKLPFNLTRLSISLWESSLPLVTCAVLEAVLAQSRRLEKLVLYFYYSPQDASFGTASKQKTVQLQHMSDLQLTLPNSKMLWAILSRLDLPQLRHLRISTLTPPGGEVLDPLDNFEPIEQIATLMLPSLESMYVHASPPGMATPLRYIDSRKPLEYVNYHIRSSSSGESNPAPILSRIPTSQAKAISFHSDISKDPYTPMIFLLNQHDLSQTLYLSFIGPRPIDGGSDIQAKPFSFPATIEAWLQNPRRTFETLPSNSDAPMPVPQLERLGLHNIACLHIVDFLLSKIAPRDGFECMVISNLGCCQEHSDKAETLCEDSSHYEDRKERFSKITSLHINIQSLAPAQDSLAIHPFWVFSHLQVLTIAISCDYGGICPYEAELLNECLGFLDFEHALAGLQLLRRMTIEIARHHSDYPQSRDHENFKSVVRAIIKAVRRLTARRCTIGLVPIWEIYLEVQAWLSRSPGCFARLR